MSATVIQVGQSISPRLRGPVDHLAGLLTEIYGDGFLGLTVFGAALDDRAGGDDEGIDTVAVLTRVELPLVRRLAEHGAELGRRGFSAPLLMTPEYIAASLDTFPLELLEIHQRHVTAKGKDFFNDLTFADTHVRLQCEREFKRVLLRIRQGLLSSGGRTEVLEALEVDIGRHLLRAMRGFLWLNGKREFHTADSVISQCGQLTGRSLSGVAGAVRTGGDHGWNELVALNEDAEALAAAANGE
ncbi:MAG: hypothetical protein HZA51_02740 [Planctomycetes bacterium]|nr:hypothetical protein [Planctomycetota bacterium]